ncbi:DUF4328 domain-containing protein [Pseudonocardia endophytica]|uniref:DUF4328 domain-containing protein n=1 Tax=Pseudonocardia endophytica TaxID=401976 RepID=UPI0014051C74|nr:DUF4328 domain-containing protein [Pseudonocardia endophytica]
MSPDQDVVTPPSGRPVVPPPSCPRCGRAAPPGRGPFCSYCGRYLAALEWVALPPDPSSLPEAARPRSGLLERARYEGPPRYRDVPRWGLPPGPWRSGSADDAPVTALAQARASASQLLPLLLVTAVVTAVGAAGEVWRYVLLLFSRTEALSPTAVAWSDSIVLVGGWTSVVGVLACGVLMISWTRHAVRAAAERSGTTPARSSRMLVAGWLVPGLNLAVPGAVLAEIEHAALGLPADWRPRPSTELLVWWALWGAGVVLAFVTALWSLRTGTQALADGVVLHAWLDVLAVVTALLTRRVVARLTRLLEPSSGGHRELLVTSRPAAPTG